MKLKSERTQDELYITNTWPSIDTYLFFKFEVRKNFGLSQLDKDGIEISCASYFCLLNVNWLQLFLTLSNVYWKVPLDWVCSTMRKYLDTMQKRLKNSHNLTNEVKLTIYKGAWCACHLSAYHFIYNPAYIACIL